MVNRAAEIRIGVSACLLGEQVRFDGGHKRNDFVRGPLADYVSFVAVCPEVDIGLGTPRETIHLVQEIGGIRLKGTRSGTDHTEAMRRYAEQKARELEKLDLSGYILKKDSPSCGMERVRVYGKSGPPTRSGRGLFAEALMARLPLLPVEEEGRLQDARLRENFIERVFAYRRLRNFFAGPWRRGDLVRFHTAEKFLLLAHDATAYEKLGRLVAGSKGTPRAELERRYVEAYMTALAKIATPRRHANVLQHMAGYFKKLIGAEDRKELAGAIEDYRRRLVPLVVPLTLLRHNVRLHKVSYLQGQVYLDLHPKELMLRNHV
jgi:uncharacterized protein YbbK (DUF523 family)/uncharacterized protein YbgA (DUF1722 family)